MLMTDLIDRRPKVHAIHKIRVYVRVYYPFELPLHTLLLVLFDSFTFHSRTHFLITSDP